MKTIANILRSTSHIEYVAQVVNPRRMSEVTSTDFSLGRFVFIGNDLQADLKSDKPVAETKIFVGLIYDTELFNPNALSLSSQKVDPQVYAPDLQDEVEILLKILLLGTFSQGLNKQNIPTESLEAGMEVVQMNQSQIKDFHLHQNNLLVRYLVNLNNIASKLNPGLFTTISAQLEEILVPEHLKIIKSIENNLQWLSVCP